MNQTCQIRPCPGLRIVSPLLFPQRHGIDPSPSKKLTQTMVLESMVSVRYDEHSASQSYTEFHPTAGKTFGKGRTIMQEIDEDDSTPETKDNIYHPFTSKQDFEMAAWLSRSNVTMSQIDDFLKLPYVCSTLSDILISTD